MRRLALLAMTATLALGVLAGCGATNDLDPDVVAEAADRTQTAGGARMAFSAELQGQALRGSGHIDTEREQSRLSIAVPGVAGRLEQIFADRTIYLRFPPALSRQIGGAKPWVKIDLDRALRSRGIELGALLSSAAQEPGAQLDQLRGAIEVRRVGREAVRGAATTRYSAVLDLRRAADRAPAAERAAARRGVDRIIALTGQRRVPAQVWVDVAGRLRRMTLSQRLGGDTLRYTVELYDFGSRGSVEVPPASQTKDLTALAAQQAP